MENGAQESNSSSGQPTKLAFTSAIGGPSFSLTILRPIENPSINSILQEDILHRRILFSKQLSSQVSSACTAFIVNVSETQTPKATGILHRCSPFPDTFELLILAREGAEIVESLQFSSSDAFITLSETTSLEVWSMSPPEETKDEFYFSMKHPSGVLAPATASGVTELSPQTEKDPVDFLRSRYFSILYSLTTPLSYFPKTTLARLRNMCGTDSKQMEESLMAVFLSPDALEQRRRLKYGLERSNENNVDDTLRVEKFEADNQRLLQEKHNYSSLSSDVKDQIFLDLKRREAQLQLLVIMQLLLTWGIDETVFLEENLAKQEKLSKKRPKQSLVRKKIKDRKQIVPTFLGVAIHDNVTAMPQVQAPVTQYSLFSSLVSLVDQMSIWDTITGKAKNRKEESMYEFLAHVFVPFFNKKLPSIVRFVLEKVKESRPNFKVPKFKRSHSLSEPSTDVSSPNLPSDHLAAESEKDKPKSSRFNKTLLNKDQKPFLRRAKTSIGENGDQPAFSLKRSKSNLGSKNLKKRQVDMSVNTPDEHPENEKSSSFIFGDARKVKAQPTFTIPQRRENRSSSMVDHDIPLVQATPAAKRVSDVIMETPKSNNYRNGNHTIPDSSKKPSMIQQTLSLLAAAPLPENSISSSPINGLSDKSPVLSSHAVPNPMTEETSSLIASSPIMIKGGVPHTMAASVPDLTNPFTKSTLQGSPTRPSQLKSRTRVLRKRTQQVVQKSKSEIVQPASKVVHDDTFVQVGVSAKAPASSFALSVNDGDTDVDVGNDATDSDSDSDFERLLASTSNRTFKKYERPKRK